MGVGEEGSRALSPWLSQAVRCVCGGVGMESWSELACRAHMSTGPLLHSLPCLWEVLLLFTLLDLNIDMDSSRDLVHLPPCPSS